MTSPETEAARDLPERLHRVLVRLLRKLAREDEALGLSRARLSALSVVEFGGPLTLGELAAAEHVRPPTMTRLVASLERDGLVAREPDPDDRRQVRIRTTRVGSRLVQQGRDRRATALAQRLARLGPAERKQVERATALLEKLLED